MILYKFYFIFPDTTSFIGALDTLFKVDRYPCKWTFSKSIHKSRHKFVITGAEEVQKHISNSLFNNTIKITLQW